MWGLLLKLATDFKLHHAPGVLALFGIGYLELYQVGPIKAQTIELSQDVKSLRMSGLEERLDKTYAALCMNPGDPAILERIRELQQEYEKVAGNRYTQPDCSLLMKIR